MFRANHTAVCVTMKLHLPFQVYNREIRIVRTEQSTDDVTMAMGTESYRVLEFPRKTLRKCSKKLTSEGRKIHALS